MRKPRLTLRYLNDELGVYFGNRVHFDRDEWGDICLFVYKSEYPEPEEDGNIVDTGMRKVSSLNFYEWVIYCRGVIAAMDAYRGAWDVR